MKKRIIALILALVMVFAFAACGQTKTEEPKKEETPKTETPKTEEPKKEEEKKEEVKEEAKEPVTEIVVANTLGMGDLDPFAASSQNRNQMRYATYEYLAVFSEFGQKVDEMEKQLAKEIVKIDDVTYEAEIYDYIYDAAGNHITAEDVAWSWNTLDESAMYNRVTSQLEKCEAIGDYRVKITLSKNITGGIEYLLAQCNVVSKACYEANEERFSTMPITTAKYQITECVDGSYYTMELNENYWQKPELQHSFAAANVPKFTIQIVTEAQQVATALQQGTVDMVTTLKTSNIDTFVNPDGTAKDGYALNIQMETTGVMLGFNMQEGHVLADNLALRQAIAYGIDKDGIVNGALGGWATKLYDVAIPGCADSNPEWLNEDYYAYNPEKAAELLKEAGYEGGIDPATGKGLHLVLLCEASRQQAAVVIQATLMQLGLDIELKAVDDAMMSANQTDPTAWDLMMSKCGADYTCMGPYNTELAKDKNGWAKRSFFVDDKFQEMLALAQTVEGNTPENVEWVHDHVADNMYKMGLYTADGISAAKAGIELYNHPWGPLVWTACNYDNYTK